MITTNEVRSRLKQELTEDQKKFMEQVHNPQDLNEGLVSVKFDELVAETIRLIHEDMESRIIGLIIT